jgi:alpha-aminoadipate carrier protein LysW
MADIQGRSGLSRLKEQEQMATAACPECGGDVSVENVEVGEIVPCDECGADLEVTQANPVVLSLAPEEGEDWGE